MDASGRIVNERAPLLPTVDHVTWIVPTGDKKHGLAIVQKGFSGSGTIADLYWIGLSIGDSVPIRIKSYREEYVTEKGIWFWTVSKTFSQEGIDGNLSFLPVGSSEPQPPFPIDPRKKYRSTYTDGSELVLTGTSTPTCCALAAPGVGLVPLRIPPAPTGSEKTQPRNFKVRNVVDIIWTHNNETFWAASGRSAFFVDARVAVQKAVAKGAYSPVKVDLPSEILSLRPIDGLRALATTRGKRAVLLIDGSRASVSAVSSTEGLPIDYIVPLGAEGFLAELGSKQESLVYFSDAGSSRAIGEFREGEIGGVEVLAEYGAAPLFFERFNEVFRESDTGHSFILSTYGMVFRFDPSSEHPLTLLAEREWMGYQPILYHDSGKNFWLTNRVGPDKVGPRSFSQDVKPKSLGPRRGVFMWDGTLRSALNGTRPLFEQDVELPTIVPFGDSRHAVAYSPEQGLLFIDMRIAFSGPELQLFRDLDAHWVPGVPVLFDPNSQALPLSLRSAVLQGVLNDRPLIQISINDGIHERRWSTADLRLGPTGDYVAVANFLGAEPKGDLTFGRACTIQATLSDSFGSAVNWTWNNVIFAEPTPLWERPWFRSVLVFIGLCLLVWVAARRTGRTRSALRLAVYAFSIGSTYLGRAWLDPGLLLGLLATSFLVGSIVGFLSPTAFRILEPLEPFKPFAGLAVSIPKVRQRLFTSYSKRLQDRLKKEREQANNETYTPLPVRVKESRGVALGPFSAKPVDQILEVLTPQEGCGANVLIEAPGGRGKSALLRELVHLALENFETNPSQAIPVFCDGEAATLFERAKEALGRDGFSHDLLRSLADGGAFFLAADGLGESGIEPKSLREHVAAFDTAVPLLLSTRPSEVHRATLEQLSAAWIVIEPERLTEDTLKVFVRVYGSPEKPLSEEVKVACRNDDGTYLPILIRLALLAGGMGMRSIRDVYASAVDHVLVRKGINLDSVVDYCLATYWVTGERRLQFANAPVANKALLRDLMAADLMVVAEPNPADDSNPHSVRFFHDSIQSYLTAVGLMRQQDWPDRLLISAADPRFDTDDSGVTELFLMCIYAFQPEDAMREHLMNSLQRLAVDLAGALSRDWVVGAAALVELSNSVPFDMAGRFALLRAAEECNKHRDVRIIGALYAHVVRNFRSRLGGH
jgi:hypothetical protein